MAADAQQTKRRGRKLRQRREAEGMLRGGDGENGSRKTMLYETLRTASRAEPISPKMERDEKARGDDTHGGNFKQRQ